MNMLSKATPALALSAAFFSPLSVDATQLPQQSSTNSNQPTTRVVPFKAASLTPLSPTRPPVNLANLLAQPAPAPAPVIAQATSQVAQGDNRQQPSSNPKKKESSSQQPQGTPPSSSARQGVFTQRGDEAAATIFLNSQERLNEGLTQGSDRARQLRSRVPGG